MSEEYTIPAGDLNWALVPLPSKSPTVPSPAIVVTSPEEILILRILLLFVSQTYKFPKESIVIPNASLNLALVPIPSAKPCGPSPARILTAAEEITILRILE